MINDVFLFLNDKVMDIFLDSEARRFGDLEEVRRVSWVDRHSVVKVESAKWVPGPADETARR